MEESILIARLLGLLRIFLGEALNVKPACEMRGPGEAFDDRNSQTGEKREHTRQGDKSTNYPRSSGTRTK